MALPLAAVPFVMKLVMALWVLTCLALVFIIMIQKGKGGGLAAAFGGGSTSSLFGAKTGDALTWITIGMAAFFLFLSVVMGLYYKPAVTVQNSVPAMPPVSTAAETQPVMPTTEGAQPEAPAGNSAQPEMPPAGGTQPETPAPAAEPGPVQN